MSDWNIIDDLIEEHLDTSCGWNNPDELEYHLPDGWTMRFAREDKTTDLESIGGNEGMADYAELAVYEITAPDGTKREIAHAYEYVMPEPEEYADYITFLPKE